MSALDRILERQRQLRQSQTQAARDRIAAAATRDAARRGTVLAGDRVFDPVTGEEGIVVHGTRENIVVPTPNR
jgi:hypothetical protein